MKKLLSFVLISFIVSINFIVPFNIEVFKNKIEIMKTKAEAISGSDITLVITNVAVADTTDTAQITAGASTGVREQILLPSKSLALVVKIAGGKNNTPDQKFDLFSANDMASNFKLNNVNITVKFNNLIAETKYNITASIEGTSKTGEPVEFKSVTKEITTNTAGKKAEVSQGSSEPVINVDAKKPVVTNKSIYNFLAPIAGMTCQDSTGLDKSCIGNNIGGYLNIIFKLGIGLAAALAVIMLIINGITYMGDESIFSKTEAKSKMFSAVLGLLIALGAWALLNTINPDLTGINGVTIDGVNVEIEPNSIFVKPASDSAKCTPVLSGPCAVPNLSTFGAQAEAMSKICNIESSGNPNAISGTDKGTDGNAFSFGLFQINLLANGKIIKDSKGETCEDLFIRTSDEKPVPKNKYINQGKYDAKLKPGMEAKYNDCKQTLLNPTKNIEIAKLLSNPTLSAWRLSDIKACPSAFN